METAPLVTVGINNYNYGRYLAQCIDSMLDQTHRNLEIIVYDDCSTDESGDVLNRYADRIKIIRSDMNSGRVLEGTNRMIEEAKGKYIYFYDADDWLEPDTIAESVKLIESDPRIDYVYSGCCVHYEDGRSTEMWPVEDYEAKDAVRRTFERHGSSVLSSKGLMRASFLKRRGYIKYLGCDVDTINTMHYLRMGLRTKAINKPFRHYRIHKSSHTHGIERRIRAINAILRYIVDHFEDSVYMPRNATINRAEYLRNYFMTVASSYLNNQLPSFIRVPSIPREEMLRYCAPLFESARIYAKGA
ncbi:MAG TPA: glycosyltransferase family 2 protein [Thermotogota bacterium]|jgi:glycosyltransferase involved in cell wall biosynthesis|nr:glycosyltransferase family 2 protein [Thermotogota bacterium]HQN22735.1 glycosyltransferase family 2 protein [Thermotogota bacterium]